MSLGDLIAWFVVVPVIWIALAFSVEAIYENPLGPLFDLWFVTALGSWALRRPYQGWAIKWRWAVVIIWALLVIALVGQHSSG
jgi:surface polysaccharide O-acyltransferase-like enzyme